MTVTSLLRINLVSSRKMFKQHAYKNRTQLTITLYLLLAITYISLVWFLPPNRSSLDKYNLSVLEGKLLSLSFVLPLIGVWFSALYGYLRFRAYAVVIRKSPEGKAFNRLADGLMVLAFGLPVSAILGTTLNYISVRYANWLPTNTIIRSYADIAIYLTGFSLLFLGARSLYATLRIRKPSKAIFLRYNTLIIITVSTVFAWLLLANPLDPSPDSSNSIYYLPNWLIIFSIAIPYLLSWYFGSMASYWMLAYKNKVSGRMYKQPCGDLAKGLAVIVFDAMLIRFITSLSPRLERLNLTPLLLLIYLLVLLYILGYGLVARGAKGLKKIEEV